MRAEQNPAFAIKLTVSVCVEKDMVVSDAISAFLDIMAIQIADHVIAVLSVRLLSAAMLLVNAHAWPTSLVELVISAVQDIINIQNVLVSNSYQNLLL